ncbi:MAG TPA: 2-C-methyl-D-erythritol 4-phosphate cytidylyltransferase [Pedobacter sp.]|nr:2-C-methyl-D-erythritol 4-phosphate cytidylyltransferase [Pedobacter sp.]
MRHYAILVAGGSGSRMQSTVAKQFLLLAGKPVLMHTIEAFHKSILNPEILVVLDKRQHDYWTELCHIHHFKVSHKIIEGGDQRFHSVKNGLSAIPEDGLVAIHDAVRPLISPELITRSYQEALRNGNCVVAIRPTDSIRRLTGEYQSVALNRNDFALVQTPQTFQINQLKQCYEVPYTKAFTDDASVAEFSGIKINIIEGQRENLKITYPEDLEIAAILLKKRGI